MDEGVTYKVLVIEATRSDETESSFLFRSAFLVIVRHPDGDSHPTGRRTRRPIRRLSWTGLFLRRRCYIITNIRNQTLAHDANGTLATLHHQILATNSLLQYLSN